MTDDGVSVGWRFAQPADMPFLYHLAVTIEPTWWRVTRYGSAPPVVMQMLQQCDALAVVLASGGRRVGAAALAEGSTVAGTAVLDLHSLPDPDAHATVQSVAPDIVRAAFEGAGLRRLYHHRFEGDPELRGATTGLWSAEVHFPDYALVDGEHRGRTTYALGAEEFTAADLPVAAP